MKTSELKERMESMGFKLIICDDGYIRCFLDSGLMALISKQRSCVLDTDCTGFERLGNYHKNYLFKLFSEYASTPIAEREDEKRYRLELISETITEKCYMGYSKKNKEYKPITFNFLRFNNDRTWKIVFTESELKKMDLTGFKKVEVTD